MQQEIKSVLSSLSLCNPLFFFHSDSVEREDTLEDNSVQLQSFVQYEPDLFVSRYMCVQHTVCVICMSSDKIFKLL